MSKKSPLYYKSGGRPGSGSPINLGWGGVLKGAKLGYKYLVPGGAAAQTALDKRDMSFGEKALRAIDDWVLFGAVQGIANANKSSGGGSTSSWYPETSKEKEKRESVEGKVVEGGTQRFLGEL